MTSELQRAWTAALIVTWRRHGTLVGAMLEAARVVDLTLPVMGNEWPAFMVPFESVIPPVAVRTHIKQAIRPWLANHARFASDALWDNKDDATIERLMVMGGVRANAFNELRADRNKVKRYRQQHRAISWRSGDKRSDWKTVK